MAPPTLQHVERDEQGAPRAKPSSKRLRKGLEDFFSDRAKVDKAIEDGKKSKFHDHIDPGSHDRHQKVQAEFEWAMKQYLDKDELLQSDIWNLATIKEYTKLYLSCCAASAQGSIGTKPTASVLFYRLRALKELAIHQIDNFDSIHQQWCAELTSHTHFLTDTHGFEKSCIGDEADEELNGDVVDEGVMESEKDANVMREGDGNPNC